MAEREQVLAASGVRGGRGRSWGSGGDSVVRVGEDNGEN
jgi:hypothetical protein